MDRGSPEIVELHDGPHGGTILLGDASKVFSASHAVHYDTGLSGSLNLQILAGMDCGSPEIVELHDGPHGGAILLGDEAETLPTLYAMRNQSITGNGFRSTCQDHWRGRGRCARGGEICCNRPELERTVLDGLCWRIRHGDVSPIACTRYREDLARMNRRAAQIVGVHEGVHRDAEAASDLA